MSSHTDKTKPSAEDRERIKIRAGDIRVGDWLVPRYGPDYLAPVTEVSRGGRWITLLIGGDDYPDPEGPPYFSLDADDEAEVWR